MELDEIYPLRFFIMDPVSHLVINPTPGLSKPFLLTKSLLPSQDNQGDTCDCKQALGRGVVRW